MKYNIDVKENETHIFLDTQNIENLIFCIDTGIRCGYSLISADKKVVAAGFFEARKNMYGTIFNFINDLFFKKKYEFETAYIEKAFINPNTPTALYAIEQRGAAKAWFEKNGIPYNETNPSKIRSLLNIRGKATDALIRESVSSIFDIPVSHKSFKSNRQKLFPADYFDALALAYYAWQDQF